MNKGCPSPFPFSPFFFEGFLPPFSETMKANREGRSALAFPFFPCAFVSSLENLLIAIFFLPISFFFFFFPLFLVYDSRQHENKGTRTGRRFPFSFPDLLSSLYHRLTDRKGAVYVGRRSGPSLPFFFDSLFSPPLHVGRTVAFSFLLFLIFSKFVLAAGLGKPWARWLWSSFPFFPPPFSGSC